MSNKILVEVKKETIEQENAELLMLEVKDYLEITKDGSINHIPNDHLAS